MIEKIIRKYAQSEVVSNMMLKNLAETGETYGIFEDVDSIKVHDEIKGLSDYASSLAKGSLTIRKIAFSTKEVNEKTYLRIGIVPKNEESFNYLTGQNESGVSVFELKDGKPVLNNLQLVDSYAGRSDSQAFIVTGEEIGIGNDGEPLLKNVKYISKRDTDFEKNSLEALENNFKTKEGEYDKEDKTVSTFFLNDFEVTYKGYTFSNPVETFKTEMGINK